MSDRSTTNPVVVLVPGAWHTPAAFDVLRPVLHKRNYDSVAVSLPSVSVAPGLPDFSADVAAVRETVEHQLNEQGRNVVLVMHSYGGVVGTEALKGLSEEEWTQRGEKTHVVALVYITRVVPKLGGSCGKASTAVSDEERAAHKALEMVENRVYVSFLGSPGKTVDRLTRDFHLLINGSAMRKGWNHHCPKSYRSLLSGRRS
ncbi:hypothetical protein VTO42DRAFT_3977 [Malbranchea cinnamomea]